MSVPVLKAGASGPQITRISRTRSDKNAATVTVYGPYVDLDEADPTEFVPDGLSLEKSTLSPADCGMGTLTLECISYDNPDGTGLSPIRTTFEVDMEEVVYDLEDHPSLQSNRATILAWLATDESKRVDGNDYKYTDKNGELQTVTGDKALKFCKAYMAGIKTFVRYYPVISKKSVWKNPPGLTREGRSFTGGSLPFSENCGKFDTPPISLSGFDDNNYFKGPENWVQNENKTWTHTEKWTYTPEGSTGEHAWIYEDEPTQSSGGNS